MAENLFLRPALSTLGVFSQPEYISEPYFKLRSDQIFRGKYDSSLKPMYLDGVTKSKCGNNDGYFRDFDRIYEGEALSNIVAIRRSWRHANNAKKIGKEWMPSNPAHQRCGLGSTAGNFTSFYPAMSTETTVTEKPPSLPNFYTNPGKKGTGYGYVEVCLNPYPEWREGASCFATRGTTIKELNEQHLAKCLGRPVFINQQASGVAFDPAPYEGVDPLAPGGRAIQKFGLANSDKALNVGPTFIPPNPPKRDGGCKDGTLNKWPEHVGEPFKEMTRIMMEKYRSPPEDKSLPPWVPQRPPAITMPSMSVVNKNVDLAINSKTRKKRLTVMPLCKKM